MNASYVMNTVSDACELYHKLEKLQHNIHRQLISRDVPGLQFSLRNQSSLLQLIKENTSERNGMMQKMGFPVNTSGMRQLLSKLPPEEHCLHLEGWNRLQGFMFKCQMLSRKNGRIQARLQKASVRLLSIIEQQYSGDSDQGSVSLN